MLASKPVRNKAGRVIARAVISVWMCRERNTRSIFCQALTRHSCSVQAPNLTAFPFMTLSNGFFPCDAVINTFLDLLKDGETQVMPISFAYLLVHRKPAEIRAWCSQSDLKDSRVRRIIIPVKHSNLGHYALAIIRRDDAVIEVNDCKSARRTFLPLLPAICASPWV